MITENDLKLVCNYSKQKIDLPAIQLSYLSYESDDKEMKLKLKQINRNIVLDKILGEESEYTEYEDYINYASQTLSRTNDSLINPFTISPKIFSINTRGMKYNKIEDIYIILMNELEKITSSKINKLNNNNNNSSKPLIDLILSKISTLQYLIATKCRINKANTIICGINAYNELIKTDKGIIKNDGICKFNIFDMNVISSNLISKNKFIVARFSNKFESGLNVINSEETNKFFLAKTHCWENNINWFEI